MACSTRGSWRIWGWRERVAEPGGLGVDAAAAAATGELRKLAAWPEWWNGTFHPRLLKVFDPDQPLLGKQFNTREHNDIRLANRDCVHGERVCSPGQCRERCRDFCEAGVDEHGPPGRSEAGLTRAVS